MKVTSRYFFGLIPAGEVYFGKTEKIHMFPIWSQMENQFKMFSLEIHGPTSCQTGILGCEATRTLIYFWLKHSN